MDDVLTPLVKLGATPADCWEWQAKLSANGYGHKQSGGKTMLAHRWMFQIFNGWIPQGAVLNHLCSNRKCVNPAHLELTTQAGNARHGKNAKLDIAQVSAIKAALVGARWGDRKQIAARFGVSPQLITDIKYGRAWREVA